MAPIHNLVDLHTHILPGIDDGSKDVNQSIRMLKMAALNGTKKIICTPHYYPRKIENEREHVIEALSLLREAIKLEDLDIELYAGSEIHVKSDTLNLIKENRLQTLNNTKYVLIEFPFIKEYLTVDPAEMIYNFTVEGYVPIVAHPERYTYVQSNPNLVFDWVKEGALMQINSNSLFSRNKSLTKVANQLLQAGLVHFIASDSHDESHRPPKLKEAYNHISTKYSETLANQLLSENGENVINNKPIQKGDYTQVKNKKRFFLF
ncbi:tyrosine-protein phosphatase [Haloplasma contractile]|uniref:protein-tyrosine-phosphatase n=1 Tax=Haloplasma contractile SSD-17B TaxID=1033810 RepID=F7Q1J6_9MOLU|nr:CpsB/CapC family capsule biosynthesis tyrosine phosphatase [Haloplasma contractile]ERJ12927.1 Capsular polysaccharide biosynthesis protein Cap5C [Haloplasma contractile SSD-17B]